MLASKLYTDDGADNQAPSGTRKGESSDEIKHWSIGVWDLYVRQAEASKKALKSGIFSWENIFGRYTSAFKHWRYLKRSVIELWPSCGRIFIAYIVMLLITSFTPALSLWFSSQMVKVVEGAVAHRVVDEQWLIQIACGRIVAYLVQGMAEQVKNTLHIALRYRISRHYAVHILRASARIDVPTFNDPLMSSQRAFLSGGGDSEYMLTTAVPQVLNLFSMGLRLSSEIVVLVDAVWKKVDGPLLVGVSIIQYILPALFAQRWQYGPVSPIELRGKEWAATTRDREYLRMEGYKEIVKDDVHRKELVASGIADFIVNEYERIANRLGSKADSIPTFFDKRRGNQIDMRSIVLQSLSHLPQLVFALRAVRHPLSIPVSIATLELLQRATNNIFMNVTFTSHQLSMISLHLGSLRNLYEVQNIENQVKDGSVPFPEDEKSLQFGVSLEFKNVSFKYPGSSDFALRNVSFKIEPGQLCVIVGSNGSGKSTILNVIARIYNLTEGTILLDGKDISTLKLSDLRRAMSILFQDYTHFPLSIKDNIGIGDPQFSQDEDRIRQAARLASAETLVESLPRAYDTFIECPVEDTYSFGALEAKGEFHDLLKEKGVGVSLVGTGMSGGQMQRLAVARTLMRTLSSDEDGPDRVGLLLFDEPSAALDPTAENDLFTKLRGLRGNKTMVFSTHRFGNLARHADLILYMDEAQILEAGTHAELLERDGDYARLWKIQAQAFL
ncbi:P-loop containing nucleoside triphosphate hydrolase protein [Amylostereum chailletii]|nr:P-loop containing nucleoside triphosphate hydrolase protein [Amylostereum chailletii]